MALLVRQQLPEDGSRSDNEEQQLISLYAKLAVASRGASSRLKGKAELHSGMGTNPTTLLPGSGVPRLSARRLLIHSIPGQRRVTWNRASRRV